MSKKLELCDEAIGDLDNEIVYLEDSIKDTRELISKLEMELKEAKEALEEDTHVLEKYRLERTAIKWLRDTMTGTDLC